MSDYNNLPPLIDEGFIRRAAQFSAANLCDGMNGLGCLRDGCMDAAIKPVCDSMRVVGTACTISTELGDNFPIHVAIYHCKPGYVMVIDGRAYTERAYLGDLIGSAAHAVGVGGIVIDGYVRDKEGLTEVGMPVFSRGYLQRSPMKKGPGAINTSIVCGSVPVSPGDLIVGDYDGITVVPRDRIEEVLERAEKKLAYEEQRRKAIENYTRLKAAGESNLPDLTPGWVKEMQQQ